MSKKMSPAHKAAMREGCVQCKAKKAAKELAELQERRAAESNLRAKNADYALKIAMLEGHIRVCQAVNVDLNTRLNEQNAKVQGYQQATKDVVKALVSGGGMY